VRIGILSDTHGHYDETLGVHFASCDEIWHAGDIGDLEVVSKLKKMAPVLAVYGNIDDGNLRQIFPEDAWIERAGMRILMTHIAGTPPRYNPRVKKLLNERTADALVCGHSHICQVKKDDSSNLLFINPGAAGQHGFHTMRTALRLELGDGKIKKLEVIELGKRGLVTATKA